MLFRDPDGNLINFFSLVPRVERVGSRTHHELASSKCIGKNSN
jgi:hypothetical protein